MWEINTHKMPTIAQLNEVAESEFPGVSLDKLEISAGDEVVILEELA